MQFLADKPACPTSSRHTVQRLSIAFFYGTGAALRPLAGLTWNIKLLDAAGFLYPAAEALNGILNSPWFWPAVKSSYAPGQKLLAAINALIARTDYDKEIGWAQAHAVTNALTEFEGAVRAELAVADAYFVTRKGGYDTSALIGSPEVLFPIDLGRKVSDAIPDVREAAKCLAFELPTASGFHLLRATESVMRRYWAAVTGGKPQPKNRNLGACLGRMKELKVGSPKVLAVLEQIKDLHRNPLMHPEEILSLDDAIGLFGIVQSAITAMLKEIPEPPLPGIPPIPDSSASQ